MQPNMNYEGERPVNSIELDIFPGKNASFELYEDDGRSLNYQQGEFAVTKISTKREGNKLTVRIRKPEGKFAPAKHTYLVRLRGSEKPKHFAENGDPGRSEHSYDERKKEFVIRTMAANAQDIELTLTF